MTTLILSWFSFVQGNWWRDRAGWRFHDLWRQSISWRLHVQDTGYVCNSKFILPTCKLILVSWKTVKVCKTIPVCFLERKKQLSRILTVSNTVILFLITCNIFKPDSWHYSCIVKVILVSHNVTVMFSAHVASTKRFVQTLLDNVGVWFAWDTYTFSSSFDLPSFLTQGLTILNCLVNILGKVHFVISWIVNRLLRASNQLC